MLIPESGADYSRVTHPFATNPQEQAPVSSFDLHVLSTPPAFVLSQDQTLRKEMLHTFVRKITKAASLIWQVDCLTDNRLVQKRNRVLIRTTSYLAFDIVHAVEFSRIGRSRFRRQASSEATSLTYHSPSACQIDLLPVCV